eukprot:scaffold10360_cov57-Attheya_sp.AAC.1
MAPKQTALSSTTMSVPAAEANLQKSRQRAATLFFYWSDSPPKNHHRFTTDSPRTYHCPYLTRNATTNAPAEADFSSTLHEN